MLLDTTETLGDSHATEAPTSSPPMAAPEAEAITMDEANEELTEVANEALAEQAAGEAGPAKPEAEPISDDDRRFWMEIEVLGEIAKCNRNIQEAESSIDDYKCSIKEEKELLKGEQIRLCRLASQLSDIIEGKPLPIDPNKPKDSEKKATTESETESEDNAWRAVTTRELLAGVSGLGPKKFDSIVETAPTAGHLEDLRGEASRAHKSFKEVLPRGCGQGLADAIEDRLIKCVASNCKSAAEQVAEEKTGDVDADEMLDEGLVEIVEEIKADLQKDYDAGAQKDEYGPADPDDKNDWFVVGFDAFGESKTLNDCPRHDDDFDRDWVNGWLSAQFVAEWDEQSPTESN